MYLTQSLFAVLCIAIAALPQILSVFIANRRDASN